MFFLRKIFAMLFRKEKRALSWNESALFYIFAIDIYVFNHFTKQNLIL